MKDQNDFFEDLIDDEPEPEGARYFDEEDDEEDEGEDEPADFRTIVLTKGGMIALLSLKVTESGAQITRFDPRETLPSAQQYDDAEAAAAWFRRSVATSRKNGWGVVYDGEPLFG